MDTVYHISNGVDCKLAPLIITCFSKPFLLSGTDRFARDIEMMTGRYVSGLMRLMWSVFVPFFTIVSSIALVNKFD